MTKINFHTEAIEQPMSKFILIKAELYRQFKIAYNNDSSMARFEELSAKMREVCETETRVMRLF